MRRGSRGGSRRSCGRAHLHTNTTSAARRDRQSFYHFHTMPPCATTYSLRHIHRGQSLPEPRLGEAGRASTTFIPCRHAQRHIHCDIFTGVSPSRTPPEPPAYRGPSQPVVFRFLHFYLLFKRTASCVAISITSVEIESICISQFAFTLNFAVQLGHKTILIAAVEFPCLSL